MLASEHHSMEREGEREREIEIWHCSNRHLNYDLTIFPPPTSLVVYDSSRVQYYSCSTVAMPQLSSFYVTPTLPDQRLSSSSLSPSQRLLIISRTRLASSSSQHNETLANPSRAAFTLLTPSLAPARDLITPK